MNNACSKAPGAMKTGLFRNGRVQSLYEKFAEVFPAFISKWKRGGFGKEIALQLGPLGEKLKTLSRSSEGDFLSLGERLQDFYVRTREISRTSSSIAGLLSGAEVAGAIEAFRAIFEQLKQFESRSGQSAHILKQVIEDLTTMQDQLEGLRKIVMFLRVLCISTKVESARVGDERSGFGILGNDVAKMAVDIETQYGRLFARSTELSRLISEAFDRVVSIDTQRRQQARIVFDRTLSNLHALTEKHAQSSLVAGEITSRYEAISRSIGEIVASMQFHDITRQRIEHSAESLIQLSVPAPSGTPRNGPDNLPVPAPETCSGYLQRSGDMCRLHAAQLRQAENELAAAVENIAGNLEEIAVNISGISGETRTMAGTANETDRSFLSEIETGVSSILSALSGYEEARRELSSAMASSSATLGDMCQFAGTIQGIGLKMKLLALNAIVKASHMEEEGAALGVLAEAIHRLSTESSGYIESVSGSLDRITTASAALSGGDRQNANDPGSEIGSITSALETQTNTLRSVNEDVISLLAKVNEEGLALSREIAMSAREIDFHRRIAGIMDAAVQQLDGIAAKTRSLLPESTEIEDAGYLKAIEATYTMEKEREIHKSILVTSGPPHEQNCPKPENNCAEKPGGTEELQADGDDLGDNIELF